MKLQARLAANAQRRKRAATAHQIASLGPLVAGVADRFAIHWNDDVETELRSWIHANLPLHGPYADQRAFRDGPDSDLAAVLANMVALHELSGWVDMMSGLGQHDVAVSVDAAAIAAAVPHLRANAEGGFDDAIIVSRTRAFALMVHHEGTVNVWTFGPAAASFAHRGT
ncbi:hypothetical protein [Phreatobacter sp.]|uniref:hypothetical protein n=1 Tax=Phreatobacter sp. TaxID=1966341 RepID=UPI003F6F3A0D